MIASVVPVTRLRRDTAWWSYLIPAGLVCQAGSLVIIPFRGRPCLGVVWDIQSSDPQAKQNIQETLTSAPLVRAPQRKLIEYLSQTGLCSLSTALHWWLPPGLRELPLPTSTRQLLEGYNQWASQPLPTHTQHAILVPGFRPQLKDQLQKRYCTQFTELFDSSVEAWFKIAKGEIRVGLGRERALLAPWLNLQQLTISEPEDISYYHEQIPYLPLTAAATQLAQDFQASLTYRSHLPEASAQARWGPQAVGEAPYDQTPSLIDLRHTSLLNPELLEAIQNTLAKSQKVLILYNAHDRVQARQEAGRTEKILIPGLETACKKLAQKLGYNELPPAVIFDTRHLLTQTYAKVGLTVIFSLDGLLQQTIFADQMHGLADLGQLLAYPAPCLIQTYQPEHPLAQALVRHQLTQYAIKLITEQRSAQLPPFSQQIVCSLGESEESTAQTQEIYWQLSSLLSDGWQISHPFLGVWRKKSYQHLVLQSDSLHSRLPSAARTLICQLPRPWKVQYNPWHIF